MHLDELVQDWKLNFAKVCPDLVPKGQSPVLVDLFEIKRLILRQLIVIFVVYMSRVTSL